MFGETYLKMRGGKKKRSRRTMNAMPLTRRIN